MRAILTLGLPGAGKTTWARRQRGFCNINLDDCREVISGDPTDQRATREAVRLRDHLILEAAAARRDLIISDTNLEPGFRQELAARLRRLGYTVHYVLFETPYAVCVRRNARRPVPVPHHVLERMYRQLRAFNHQRALGTEADRIQVRRS